MINNRPYWVDSPFNIHFINSTNLLEQTFNSSESGFELDENMYAIQTILNTVITIEAVANCLIDDLNLPKRIKEEVDKFKILSKFEYYLQIKGQLNMEYGSNNVQKIKELISIRNDLVHSKVKKISGTISNDKTEENLDHFISESKEKYNNTQIPKSYASWGLVEAKVAVSSFLDFINYIFNSLCFSPEDVSILLLPKQYDSNGDGIWMIDKRLEISFKKLNNILMSEITPFIDIEGTGQYTEFH